MVFSQELAGLEFELTPLSAVVSPRSGLNSTEHDALQRQTGREEPRT